MSKSLPNDNTANSFSAPEKSNLENRENTDEIVSKTILKNKVLQEKTFVECWKTNRFWLIKGAYYFFHYTWVVVMAVGAFIAWLIAMLMV